MSDQVHEWTFHNTSVSRFSGAEFLRCQKNTFYFHCNAIGKSVDRKEKRILPSEGRLHPWPGSIYVQRSPTVSTDNSATVQRIQLSSDLRFLNGVSAYEYTYNGHINIEYT